MTLIDNVRSVICLNLYGILRGAALIYANGTPGGFSWRFLRLFMTDQKFIVTPVVVFVLAFVVLAVLLLINTASGGGSGCRDGAA